jgi:hypothetical protein
MIASSSASTAAPKRRRSSLVDSLVPVILDAVVVTLLTVAIVFGVRLHRRLVKLQSAQSELAALLGRLDGALVQASTTVSALKYNTAKQFESIAPRAPATPPAERPAQTSRPAAPVEMIKTAPTKVEAAKPMITRRRKPASLVAGGRESAADELMAVLKSLRNAG